MASTILSYESSWPIYGLDWCNSSGPPHNQRPRAAFRIAISSYTEDYRNRLAVIGLLDEQVLLEDDYSYSQAPQSDFVLLAEAMHGYPATKLQWQPASATNHTWAVKPASSELLATTGDALRIWEFQQEGDPKSSSYVGRQPPGGNSRLAQKIALSGSKTNNPVSAPLTSFSWNTIAPSHIVTASIDTTCTVWDISTSSAVTQLIAHDREVYDVAWLPGSSDIFTSVGADGSLRAFDLRSLEHSTILYETPSSRTTSNSSPAVARSSPAPLVRIAFNPNDANYMSTFHMDSSDVQVLDMRSPGQPVAELKGHRGQVNAMGWGAAEGTMLATAGDDCQVLVWDLGAASLSPHAPASAPRLSSPRPDTKRKILTDPALAYTAPGEINNLAWSPPIPGMSMSNGLHLSGGEWIAICAGKTVKALKV